MLKSKLERLKQAGDALQPWRNLKPLDRVLILSAHPDDEILSSAGLIQRALAVGAKVRVVEVTDGNRRGKRAKRRLEVASALAVLGLPEKALQFWDFPDGRLWGHQELTSRIEQELAQFEPSVVLASDPLDSHKDHRYLGQTVAQLRVHYPQIEWLFSLIHFSRFPRPIGYLPQLPLLPPAHCPGEWRTLNLTPYQVVKKAQAIKQFRSQLFTPLLRGLMFSFMRPNEIFRQL